MDIKLDRRSWELGFITGRKSGLKDALVLITTIAQSIEEHLKEDGL